jgi:hypothetical protein
MRCRYSAQQIEFGGLFVRIIKIALLVVMTAAIFSIVGCGNGHHEEIVAPINIEMPSDNLQHRIGVSGFIFGTFVLLNAYVIIVLSLITLLVKESVFSKIIDIIRMLAPMVIVAQDKQEKFLGYLVPLSDADTRVKIGSVGLLAGLVAAYLGAWIAL